MVVRHWREDTTVVAEEELPAGPVTVEGILEKDGTVTLGAGGKGGGEGTRSHPDVGCHLAGRRTGQERVS